MLQVWLPLNGNIKNQGLSNYTIDAVRGSIVYNDSGKIGKCFYAHGVNTLRINNIIPDFYNYSSYSLCAWFYIEAQNTTHSGSAVISAGNWNAQVLNLALGKWSTDHYTTLRISGTSWSRNYAYNFFANQWYHVVVSSDGTSTKAYVNGVLINDTAPGFLPTSIEGNDIYIGGASYYSGMQFFGRINDVRIYDHALSEKEVQEIAKGLVVHYKLGQSIILDSFSYDTNIYEEPDGSSWLRIIHHNNPTTNGYFNKTDTWDTGVYLSEDKWFRINVVDKLSSFEFMVKQKTTASATEAKYRWTQTKNPKEAVYNDVKPGTVTFNTSSGYTNSSFGGLWQMNTNARLCIANSNAGNWYGAFGSWTVYQTNKLPGFPNTEITTGYMDLYVRIDGQALFDKVYDCSGYQNNAMNVNCTISTDTAKYNASIAQKSGQYIRSLGRPNNFLPHDAITVNLWMKCTTWGNPISCIESGGFNFEANGNYIYFPIHITHSSGTSYAGARTSITRASLLNDWHMITGVYDGTNTIIYVDGEESGRNTTKYSGVIHYQNNYLFIGAEAQGDDTTPANSTFVGNISDVRIYATALSAAAIKDLYETSAEIDNKGNLFVREIIEK